METVTIPEFMRPFECTINNVRYGPYAPGTTVEVPAEVAALIRNNAALEPRENPPETIEEEIARIAAEIADAKITAALDEYPAFVDLSSVSFTPGTPKTITTQLPKADALDIIKGAFERPTAVCVKYSSVKHTLTATTREGDGNSAELVFCAPFMSGDEILRFITFALSVEGNTVSGLLGETAMPEAE